jgi:large subunit ribosomal protein L29
VSKRSDRLREIRALDMASAQKELDEKRKDLFMLRLRKERGEVKNNREFPQLKKDIARLLQHMTDLNNAEQLEASGALDEADEAEAAAEPAAPVTVASATEGEE